MRNDLACSTPCKAPRLPRYLIWVLLLAGLMLPHPSPAEPLSIAAASDLKYAMDELITAFKSTRAGAEITPTYGSSGKFATQIQQGAAFDLFFSADIAYADYLAVRGFAVSEVRPYAIGRLVLWSTRSNASSMTLESLAAPDVKRIAVANPNHAPYGLRAIEALKSSRIYDQVKGKLIMGENVAQAAQFAATENADVGIIALSLALNPELSRRGGYTTISATLHEPLTQGFIVTKSATDSLAAKEFADFVSSAQGQAILARHGFTPPGERR